MPHSWVADEAIWKRAKKKAVLQGQSDNHALIAHIYQQMGGKKKEAKKSMKLIVKSEGLAKAGPFFGPKGGKYADSQLTIPWTKKHDEGKAKQKALDAKSKEERQKSAKYKDKAGGFADMDSPYGGPEELYARQMFQHHRTLSSMYTNMYYDEGDKMAGRERSSWRVKEIKREKAQAEKHLKAAKEIMAKEEARKKADIPSVDDITKMHLREKFDHGLHYEPALQRMKPEIQAAASKLLAKEKDKLVEASKGKETGRALGIGGHGYASVQVESKAAKEAQGRLAALEAMASGSFKNLENAAGASMSGKSYRDMPKEAASIEVHKQVISGLLKKKGAKKSMSAMIEIEEIELLAKSYGKKKKGMKMDTDLEKELGEDGDETLEEESPDDESDIEKAFAEILDLEKSMGPHQAYDSSPTIDKNPIKTEGHKHHEKGGVIQAPDIKDETLDPDGDPNGGHDHMMDSNATVVHNPGGHGDELAQGPHTQANQSGFKSPGITTDGKHDHFETGGGAGIKAPSPKPENITMGGDPNGGQDMAAPTTGLVVKSIMDHNLEILDKSNPHAAAYVRMNHEMIEKSYGIPVGSMGMPFPDMTSYDPKDVVAMYEKLKRVLKAKKDGGEGYGMGGDLPRLVKAMYSVKYMAKDYKSHCAKMGVACDPEVEAICEKLEACCDACCDSMYQALM